MTDRLSKLQAFERTFTIVTDVTKKIKNIYKRIEKLKKDRNLSAF